MTTSDLQAVVPVEYAAYVTLGLAVANLIVRKFTTGPPARWAGRRRPRHDPYDEEFGP